VGADPRIPDPRIAHPGIADWNVVATVRGRNFRRARDLLEKLGRVGETGYYNVLVMRVDDVEALLEQLDALGPDALASVGHVRPARRTFGFQTPEEFEARARRVALDWVAKLASSSFHVRLHRRGFKGRIASPEEERFLDEVLLEALEQRGTPGRIRFEDPDAIVAVDTVDNRAGMALWTRAELRRFRFLGLD
jgi:tRNA(Ser,Leu) C12 N-acetylase TAN1